MAIAQERARFDSPAYLAREAVQTERHEFVDGEVSAMTGARDFHDRVALNIAFFFKQSLRGTPAAPSCPKRNCTSATPTLTSTPWPASTILAANTEQAVRR